MDRSRICKIIVLGDGGVGKTSIRRRYFGDKFAENYNMTIGADFSVKNQILNDRKYVLQIWDLAGQPRFQEVRNSYYKGLTAAILVFDVTRIDTYLNIPLWVNEALENCNTELKDIPFVLLGNKSDLRHISDNAIPMENIQDYVDNELSNWFHYPVKYFETSAKTNLNIENTFRHVVELIEWKDRKSIQ